MSEKLTLSVKMRDETGTQKVKPLRRQGIVPAIIYGGAQRNYPVQVSERALGDLLKKTISNQVLVTLTVEGAEAPEKLALIQAVQRDALTGRILHVDFNAIREDRRVRATIPIELIGEPAGVKVGGLTEQLLRALPISCLPKHLPESIEVDISHLGLSESIHVEQIKFPEGVRPEMPGQVLVATVVETRAAKAASADRTA